MTRVVFSAGLGVGGGLAGRVGAGVWRTGGAGGGAGVAGRVAQIAPNAFLPQPRGSRPRPQVADPDLEEGTSAAALSRRAVLAGTVLGAAAPASPALAFDIDSLLGKKDEGRLPKEFRENTQTLVVKLRDNLEAEANGATESQVLRTPPPPLRRGRYAMTQTQATNQHDPGGTAPWPSQGDQGAE